MATPPTVKWQNQAAATDLPDRLPLPGQKGLDPFAKSAPKQDQFQQATSLFDQFLGKLKHSAFEALKQAAKPAGQPLGGAPAPGQTPKSFEAMFVHAFGQQAYPTQLAGQESYVPRSPAAWEVFYRNIQALGSRLQDMRMRLGPDATVLFRGVMKNGTAGIAIVADIISKNPDAPEGRELRTSFVQVLSPAEAAVLCESLLPGQPLPAELKSVLGEEVSVRRLVHFREAADAGTSQDRLMQMKSGVSDSQNRFEALVMAQRGPREVREKDRQEQESLQNSTLSLPRNSIFPFLIPFWPRPDGNGTVGSQKMRGAQFLMWVLIATVIVVMYLLIQAWS